MSSLTPEQQEAARRIRDWRNMSPLPTAYSSTKTTDPEAHDYERSIELYREGLRAARRGDLQTGRTKIAAAYLLDDRCSRWYAPVSLPPEVDPEMQYCMLDFKLLAKLVGLCDGPNDVSELNLQDNDPAPKILSIFLIQRSGAYQENQALCTATFHSTQKEIDTIAKDPSSYENNPRVLDGCLTRAAIHERRSFLYNIMNNPKKAARELKRALAIEPDNYKLLAEYAMLNSSYSLAELNTIVQDCQTVIANIHPDNRRVRQHMYAILALAFLEFPALGTFDQALAFYEQMKQSQQRQIDLYGEREIKLQGTTSYCRQAHEKFDTLTPQDKAAQRGADAHMGCNLFRRMEQVSLQEAGDAAKRLCMNCKTAGPGVNLRKCSRCKQVAYCSKECQTADWKNHKRACKLHAELKKESAP